MKILVVCQYYYPEQFRINEICEQLINRDHQVTVLTGLPNYPTGRIPSEYRFGRKRKEIINGVKVLRSFEIGRRDGIVGRALNYSSYMVSASLKALFLKKDFDCIFVYQLSPVTMALPGIILKKLTNKPLYLYCCDIWPESMKNFITNEDSIVYKIIKKFSTFLYSKCDEITVTSKPFIEYFSKEHEIPSRKISYLPQHAEDIYMKMDLSPAKNTTDFIFLGNIGIAQDIDCILDAAEKIKDTPNFRIHFVGEGSYLNKSKNIVKEKGIDNIVVFHGRQPLERMPKYYQLADACLITLKDENLTGLTMPSKLQGYMAAGKVVIGAINGAAQEVVLESRCGVCVNASNSRELARVMKDFIGNPDKYKNCGKNGRQYFKKHFTIRTFIEKLEKKLNGLVEGGIYVQR